MEVFVNLLYASIFILVGVFIFWMIAREKTQLLATYRELAKRLGGTTIEGSWLGRASVEFPHRFGIGRLDAYDAGGKEHRNIHTRVRVPWPDRFFRCSIKPEQTHHTIGKLLGMQDVEIGSPSFDEKFVLSTNDPQSLRELLNPEAQQLLLRMGFQFSCGIRGGEFTLIVDREYGTSNELYEFVRTCLKLYDTLLHHDVGITFLEEPRLHATLAAPEKPPVCQICGDEIHADVVLCSSCKTPHHDDCWNYYGSCSTYACRSRECYRPKTAGKRKKK